MTASFHVDNFRGFALAAFAFLVVVAFFGFLTGVPATLGVRALDATKYAGAVLLAGVAVGLMVWGCITLIRGRGDAPDLWDTTMSVATLIGVACVAMRMFS